MRMYLRQIPSGRRGKPKRRAKREVYEALAGINRRGFVYYEWRKGHERIEPDFAVWIEELGRIALQVKGDRYLLIDGEWRLKIREGVQPNSTSPLDEAWLTTLNLHDDIEECTCMPYSPHVIPVVLFPDMTEPDESIENLAKHKGMYVASGAANLLIELEKLVPSRKVSNVRAWSADCQRRRVSDRRGPGLDNPEIRQSADCHHARRPSSRGRPPWSRTPASTGVAQGCTQSTGEPTHLGRHVRRARDPTATASRRRSPDPSTTTAQNTQTLTRGERK